MLFGAMKSGRRLKNAIIEEEGNIMPYLIYAIDFDNMDQIREQNRDAHRKHLRSIGDKLLASGAILDEDGVNVIGGMSIIDTEIYSEAEHFALSDPYQEAGIRKEVKICKWRKRWWEGKLLVR